MEIEELESFIEQHDDFEVRVITHSGSQCHQVELEDMLGARHMLTRRGTPMVFRSLDDIYLALKRVGIRRAFLVQNMPEEEVVGRAAHYRDPLAARVPLTL